MIEVTRLNGKTFFLNPDLIETMETTPDTVIALTGGNKYVVTEAPRDLIQRIAQFRRRCHPDYLELEERQRHES